jgi:hypothetical protein
MLSLAREHRSQEPRGSGEMKRHDVEKLTQAGRELEQTEFELSQLPLQLARVLETKDSEIAEKYLESVRNQLERLARKLLTVGKSLKSR